MQSLAKNIHFIWVILLGQFGNFKSNKASNRPIIQVLLHGMFFFYLQLRILQLYTQSTLSLKVKLKQWLGLSVLSSSGSVGLSHLSAQVNMPYLGNTWSFDQNLKTFLVTMSINAQWSILELMCKHPLQSCNSRWVLIYFPSCAALANKD